MEPAKQKQLVKSLIKDDLINNKLIMGLTATGLQAENFSLYLSGTIFGLLGYKDNKFAEKVYFGYVARTKKACEIDNSSNNDGFDSLVNEIYDYLIQNKPKNTKK